MNDRYLYRAKRKNWRELQKEKWWVTGYLVNKKCGKYSTVGFEEFEEMVIVTQFSDGGIDWCYIEKDTICQCTGLKDKNGKLILENDIVKHDFGEDQIGVQLAIVKYDSKYACYQIKPIYDWMYCDKSDCEVIGNIFDNPELLEK